MHFQDSVRILLLCCLSWIYHAEGSGSAPAAAMRCHDCTGATCGDLIARGLTGKCGALGLGKCFIRQDPNGLVYRGCADEKKWPKLDYSYVGCKYQRYQMWDKTPVLWCFCDFDLCNINSTYLKEHYGGFRPSASPATVPKDRAPAPPQIPYSKHIQVAPNPGPVVPQQPKAQYPVYKSQYPSPQVQQQVQKRPAAVPSADSQSLQDVMARLLGPPQRQQRYPQPVYPGSPGYPRAGQQQAQQIQYPLYPGSPSYPQQPRQQQGPTLRRRPMYQPGSYKSAQPTPAAGNKQGSTNLGGNPTGRGYLGNLERRVPSGNRQQPIRRPIRRRPMGREGGDGGFQDPSDIMGAGQIQGQMEVTQPPVRRAPAPRPRPRPAQAAPPVGKKSVVSPPKVPDIGSPGGISDEVMKALQEMYANHTHSKKTYPQPPPTTTPAATTTPKYGKSIGNIMPGYHDGKGIYLPWDEYMKLKDDAKEPSDNDVVKPTADVPKETSCPIGTCEHSCDLINDRPVCSCREGYVLNKDGRTCKDYNECAVFNGGCEQLCTNTLGSYYCSCVSRGYRVEGEDGKACRDVDECSALDRGGCSHDCQNTVGSFVCHCPSGYQLGEDGRTCQDYNECKFSPDAVRCEQTCVNTAGSYTCACRDGYRLNADGVSCDDINECQENKLRLATVPGSPAICEQLCQNTPGSFRCLCYHGYSLDADGSTCRDTNECATNNGDCEHQCVNLRGSHKCMCDRGYKLNPDARTCDDVNECLDNNGGCSQLCMNKEAGYECACQVGYLLDFDGKSCIDNNECLTDNGGCQQVCQNAMGSFSCECNSGYQLNIDARTCNAIDACSINNGGCDHSCVTTPRGVVCSCRPGHMLDVDDRTCIDQNECQQNNGGCQQICRNVIGSHECMCRAGFTLNVDGRSCDDINECQFNNGGCVQNCINTPGSYSCGCRPGYRLAQAGGGKTGDVCEDVNECVFGNGGCAHNCTNTAGSFYCSCKSDLYQLQPDGRTCAGQCPANFYQSQSLQSCYRVFNDDADTRNVAAAKAACRQQHPKAELLSIESEAEQKYVGSILHAQPEMLNGWQGWWSSGIYNSGTNIFQFESGAVIDTYSSLWGFKKSPYEDTCVWILQIPAYNYTLGNYDCTTKSGFVCEIDLKRN